jgi:hypothetical protein
MNAARARVAAVDRHVISTRWGVVEYAELGSGDPVLVVHGIFDNCLGAVLFTSAAGQEGREFSEVLLLAEHQGPPDSRLTNRAPAILGHRAERRSGPPRFSS